MSLYTDLMREILLDPSKALRLAIPKDGGGWDGLALTILASFCKANPQKNTAGVLHHFAESEFIDLYTQAIGYDRHQAASDTPDHFLLSREWQTVRYRALELHGGACQACARTAADGIVINVDHIKPRIRFPELALSLDNLQVLCNECNRGKGNQSSKDWRPNSRSKPKFRPPNATA